ncbi:glycosyltransferase family 2 protein, partial [Amanita rubescens]
MPMKRNSTASFLSANQASSSMNPHQKLEATVDLSQLTAPSTDVIVACLRERFMSDTIYTRIGSCALIALNPHKYVPSNSDSVLNKYAAEYRDTSEGRDKASQQPPHIFQLSNNAYYHMKRTGQDNVFFSAFLELSVSNPGKKGSKLGSQVPASEFVLETFGKRTHPLQPQRFPFWKVHRIAIQVAGAPSGERNFHIFYYLVAGAYLGQRHQGQGGRGAPGQGGRDDDAMRFDQLKVALKAIGLSKRHVAQTCQLIAAILHLGNLEFIIDRGRNEDAAVVRNTDVLEIVSEFLGIQSSALEVALSYKTKLVKKELCTVFLDPDGASDNRDDLAKTLYSLLFGWLNEYINQKLCRDDFATFIGLFDLPGPQNLSSRPNTLDQFCINFANERLQHFLLRRLFESHGISRFVPSVPYFDNSECVRLLQHKPGGLIHIMDDQHRWGNHSSFKSGSMDRSGYPTFTGNAMDSSTADAPGSGLGNDGSGSVNPFVKGLFSAKAIATVAHPRNEDTIVAAHSLLNLCASGGIRRMPTLLEGGDREKDKEDDDFWDNATGRPGDVGGPKPCTQPWFVFCVNPNDAQLPNQLEGRSVKGQVKSMGLAEIANASLTPREFCDRYKDGLENAGVIEGGERERVEQQKVFLSQFAFHKLEDGLRSRDVEELKRNRMRAAEAEAGLDPRGGIGGGDMYGPYPASAEGGDYGDNPAFGSSNQHLPSSPMPLPSNFDERKSLRSDDFDGQSNYTSQRDAASNYGSESYAPSRNMFQGAEGKGAHRALLEKEALAGEIQEGETTEVIKESSARRKWVALCWILTWWCPNFVLRYVGRMKRMDVRQAWREKLALNLIIWFICGCAVFVIAVLGRLICPTEHVFNTSELASHTFNLNPSQTLAAIRGEVFDLTTIAALHGRVVSVVPTKNVLSYGGQIITDMFPVQVSALCNGITGSVSPYVTFNPKNVTDPNAQYHDFRVNTMDYRPDWYFETMVEMRYLARKGYVGYTKQEIRSMASSTPPGRQGPPGTTAPNVDPTFMDQSVLDVFSFAGGGDVTKQLDNLNIDSATLYFQKVCLRNLFLIGMCQFSSGILLALSFLMVAVIGFKFLASINFGAERAPEDHDKFVICQVPCYTEGETSLRRRLIHPNLDPEPLSFVYSGLYECSGHVLPYMVIVKAGNRGKRDSQMMLMHFLNKVRHYNSPMNPLELEMYHQIKNVVGVNPTFYEYFTVDADTTVEPLSLNRLVSAMIHDKKLLGVCVYVTMMQVYEYFISHHMAKAFESLFGSVTCLPGCFTLYRLRTPDTQKPLLISNPMVIDYSENRVDTLHMKNLLHLGEDRYLTTLLLRHFPCTRLSLFATHTHLRCSDDWKVLLSQRRRWINSTVHNLGELVFLEQLCGFCCFSMRLSLVFIMRRKWDMIGWMLFYIIAIPAFSFLLPLYSFWKDDFSWGATRVVLVNQARRLLFTDRQDEGKFDPKSIPLKSWSDYENELWDKESNHSIGSWVPPTKLKDGYAESHTASLYGRETYYEPRAQSPAPSQFGMGYAPPGYQSGRNTPQSYLRP